METQQEKEFALDYQAPQRRRFSWLMWPILGATLLLGAPLFSLRIMGLVFDALPGLNVDNAQIPVVALPLVMLLLNLGLILHGMIAHRRGIWLAATGALLAGLELAAAVLFWVPAFKM